MPKNRATSSRRAFVKALPLHAAGLAALPALSLPPPAFDPSWFSEAWERSKAFTLAFAEAMPENRFIYRPRAEVRTYTEQLLHVAGSNVFFAGLVTDAPAPALDLDPAGKTKADVIATLSQAFDYAATAIEALDAEQAEDTRQVAGQTLTKWQVLMLMRDHVTHHRGQMVMYLRLNGQEPPQYVGF